MRAYRRLIVILCLAGMSWVSGQGQVNDRTEISGGTSITGRKATDANQIKGTLLAPVRVNDTINLNRESSLKYLQKIYSASGLWRKAQDPLREAIGVLIYHASRLPLDSTTAFLTGYDWDKLRLPAESLYVFDSIKIILPQVAADTLAADSLAGIAAEMFISTGDRLEKVELSRGTVPVAVKDTLSINDSVYILVNEIIPNNLPRHASDTIILVVTDTLPEPVHPMKDFPFRRYRYQMAGDSINAAVKSLITFLEQRDSSLVSVLSESGRGTDVWLNGRSGNLMRFWLPDSHNDSVTVWIGSPAHNTLIMNAEEGVVFKKQLWHDNYVDTKVNVTSSKEEELRKVEMMKINPVSWKLRTDASYLLSQGWIENWAKGGENSISSVLDITEYIDYTDKVKKITSNTTVRFALGFQATGKRMDLRKNLDLFEINSKLNHKAFGKFDLSGIFQFKTQALPGRIYPNDTTSVIVSKFFNPATLIVGYGLDYKPNKKTSISFSPLSYKGTFVPDTALIDQTKYGIAADRKSKNEMGAYLTITNKTKLFEKVDVTNKVQFFSNFLSKPQNIDVDWEVIMTSSLNWFTEVRLNMHLIYDDNTLLGVTDSDGDPVTGPDGKQKKVPLVQFKELLGLSFVFKF